MVIAILRIKRREGLNICSEGVFDGVGEIG
jgi:hypothetical protein